MKRLNVAEKIDSPSALTQEQGDVIRTEIIKAFQNREKIIIDFLDVESIISPFLNHAIGHLYEKYDSAFIRENLLMEHFPPEKNSTLNVVIGNAKKYYANKEQFSKAVKEVIDNE